MSDPRVVRNLAFVAIVICSSLQPTRGQFLPPILYNEGVHPNNIAIGDMNRDGIADIVTSHFVTPQGITILTNDGHGQLAPFLFIGGFNPNDMKLADLDGNGYLDIVMADNSINVLLGSGTTIFSQVKNTFTGSPVESIAVADFTGDGKPDILATRSNDIALMVGKGDGFFDPLPVMPIHGSGLAAADVNMDGVLDFVTVSADSGTDAVRLMLGTGGGGFSNGGDFSPGTGADGLALSDVNGDGILDVLVTSVGLNGVSIWIGNGQAQFTFGSTLSATNSPISPVTGDFNADGIVDIAVVNQFAQVVSSFKGFGSGQFETKIDFPTGGVFAYEMVATDLDGNGIPDLAIVNGNVSDISILLAAATTCGQVLQSVQSVRLGSPPNPLALIPDPTHGPVVGLTWQPFISHASFAPGALTDVLITSLGATNIPSGFGTLLCDVSKPNLLITVSPGQPFVLPVPELCVLIGFSINCQGASLSLFSNKLTNAIDATIGTF